MTASEQARGRKIITRSQWSEARFFEIVKGNLPPKTMNRINDLYEFVDELTNRKPYWGTGKETGSFTGKIDINNHLFSVFSVYTDGNISINIGWNHKRLAEIDKNISEKFRKEVNQISKESITKNSWENGWPKTALKQLSNQKLNSLKNLLEKFKKELLEN